MSDMTERKNLSGMESNAQLDIPGTEFVRNILGHPERFIHHVVQDDSLSPDLRRGDVVVIDTEEKLKATGIFAVDTRFGTQLFRLQCLYGGGVKAIKDYPEKEVFELDGEPEVIGRVVLILRKVA